MKKLITAIAALTLVSGPVFAGSPVTIQNAANTAAAPVDSTGLHVVCASGCSAGSSAAFVPTAGAVANLTVGVASADVALPAGTTVVVTNTGAADAAFRIQVGAGTALTTDYLLKSGAAVGIAVGTATHLSAILPSGSTTTVLNIQGGDGQVSGYGGGSGGGVAGTVAQGTPATQTAANAWTVIQPDSAVQTGTITNNGDTVTLALPVGGYSSFGIQVSGTWSGSLQVKGSVINCTNSSVTTTLPLASGITSGVVSANGNYQGNAASLKCIQITGLSMASGTANITMSAGAGVGPVMQDNAPWVVGGFSTGASTTGVAATVKAASTAPATTDTALVTSTADGNNVTLGAKGDAATCATTNTAIACLRQIDADVKGAIPAGTATIGSVGLDPSQTPATTVAVNVSTATTTQLVALSGSTSIYVTGGVIIAGGTGNITFEYGTGSSCGTGTTVLSGAIPLVANVGFVIPANTFVAPSGKALCIVTSAAVQMSGAIGYVQK